MKTLLEINPEPVTTRNIKSNEAPIEFNSPAWLKRFLSDGHDSEMSRIPTVVGAWQNGDEPVIISQHPSWKAHLNIPEMLWECFYASTLSTTMEWKRGDEGFVCLHDNPLKMPNSDIRVLWLAPEATPIEVNRDDSALLDSGHVLVALAFIAELRRLLLRSRRLEFQPETSNLVGRIKGKPLIQRNLRENVAKGRLDRITCQFLSRTMDNPVNRVFKCTLQRCRTLLKHRGATGSSLDSVWTAVSFCDSVLADVALQSHLRDSDFNQPGLRGFYQGHANILSLARAVHRNFIYAGKTKTGENAQTKPGKIVPFLINTPHLFERWVIGRAKRVADANGWWLEFPQMAEKILNPQSEDRSFPGFAPDMLFRKNGKVRILDAKYKKYWEKKNCPESVNYPYDYKEFRHDLHQILAYKSIFSADRVGIIFPSSGGDGMREDFEPHPDKATPLLSTLAVCPIAKSSATNIDNMLEEFLNNP